MKKSILFCIDSLDCAGAEKSLVTLLSMLDYTKFEVDLMLFAHGNVLEELVPNEVNILKPLKYTEFSKLHLKKSIKYAFENNQTKMMIARINYSTRLRIGKKSNPQKARIYWKSISNVISENDKPYDVAISFAQGVPTFYVAEKVKAKKKLAWVNVSYRLEKKDKIFQQTYYDQFDKIVAVSDSACEVFLETFPKFIKNVEVVYDINNPHFISRMSNIGNGFEDSFDGIRILTIGRLANQKGYDIALEACKKLKEKGVNFRWYILGKGPLKKEIENYIIENNLSKHFILLGIEANPYPFIKKSDIYVQTSRYEGFGLAIAEARMLNTPVVTTRFDAVYNQMIDRKNGLVVDMNAKAVSDGVMEIISNTQLRTNIITYLKAEKKGNLEEIKKFYQLIV